MQVLRMEAGWVSIALLCGWGSVLGCCSDPRFRDEPTRPKAVKEKMGCGRVTTWIKPSYRLNTNFLRLHLFGRNFSVFNVRILTVLRTVVVRCSSGWYEQPAPIPWCTWWGDRRFASWCWHRFRNRLWCLRICRLLRYNRWILFWTCPAPMDWKSSLPPGRASARFEDGGPPSPVCLLFLVLNV